MSIIINTNSREEYNSKISFYQVNGFRIAGTTANNIQTRLIKKNFGPVWAQAILIVSLIGSIFYLSELVIYPLAFTDLFIRLNLFSLLLAIRYLQEMGFILLALFLIMVVVIIYYYLTKEHEVIVKFNPQINNQQQLNNQQQPNNNINYAHENGGNYNG